MKNQHARALPLGSAPAMVELSDWMRIPSLFGVCTHENTAC